VPEGDTIFRAARSLDRILTGRRLVRFELHPAPGLPPPAGRQPAAGELVTSVRAQGKHLLIAFEGGLTLHSHLGMHGGWHAYRPGEPWKKPRRSARVVIEVADPGEPGVAVAVAVCFAAPVVEMVADVAAHPRLAALGPDLCRPDADLGDAVARLGGLPPDSEIGTALLDQRVACGVGNVYKSETLFACRVNPFTPVGALSGPVRRLLLETAARLLRANLEGGPRATVGGPGEGRPGRRGGLAVYGRAGRPCRRCGTAVRRQRQGESGRLTFWCPNCQPGAGTGASSAAGDVC
jgi:endonuclease-8